MLESKLKSFIEELIQEIEEEELDEVTTTANQVDTLKLMKLKLKDQLIDG